MALVMPWDHNRFTPAKSTTTSAQAISMTSSSLTSSIRAPSSWHSALIMGAAMWPTVVFITNLYVRSAAIYLTTETTIIKSYFSRLPHKTSSKTSTSELIIWFKVVSRSPNAKSSTWRISFEKVLSTSSTLCTSNLRFSKSRSWMNSPACLKIPTS